MGFMKPKVPPMQPPPAPKEPELAIPRQGDPEFDQAERLQRRKNDRGRRGRAFTDLSGQGDAPYSRTKLG